MVFKLSQIFKKMLKKIQHVSGPRQFKLMLFNFGLYQSYPFLLLEDPGLIPLLSYLPRSLWGFHWNTSQ